VTITGDTVSYSVVNNTNLPGIAAGKSYVFTPNVPSAPTGLSFSLVTQTSMQLSWTDNSSNEAGFAIYRSTDGTNFTFLTQTAANATSASDTGLLPSTTYHYRVYAVTEGALSSALAGNQTTSPTVTFHVLVPEETGARLLRGAEPKSRTAVIMSRSVRAVR
jgi:hypothetical protein